jgi:serine/threonine protein kinase
LGENETRFVAVKIIDKSNASDQENKKITREVEAFRFLRNFGHENLLRMYSFVADNEKFYYLIVRDYTEFGNLKECSLVIFLFIIYSFLLLFFCLSLFNKKNLKFIFILIEKIDTKKESSKTSF